MVVFGCGAGVKGLSAASRRDGMAFSIHVVPRSTAVSTKIKASWRRR
jgi:hypothetical protein